MYDEDIHRYIVYFFIAFINVYVSHVVTTFSIVLGVGEIASRGIHAVTHNAMPRHLFVVASLPWTKTKVFHNFFF